MPSLSRVSTATRSRLPSLPATRFWWSTPPRSAAIPRNIPVCRRSGRATAANGLMVLGVPSNDFGGQEPGGKSEIQQTAQGDYHVTFPLTEKVAVKGKAAHPFYRWAALERPAGGAALEFPQIPDRPRWTVESGLYLGGGAHRSPLDRGNRAGIAPANSGGSCCGPVTFRGRRHKSDKFQLTNRPAHEEVMTEFWSRGPASFADPLRGSSRVAFRLGGRKAALFHDQRS